MIDQTSSSPLFMEEIRRRTFAFSGRERDILTLRLGLNGEPQTLQQIAGLCGITRERVRQVERNVMRQLADKSDLGGILEIKIRNLMLERDLACPAVSIEEIDPWFRGISSQFHFFMRLVEKICEKRIRLIKIDEFHYFSLVNQQVWERASSKAAALLARAVDQEYSEDQLRSLVRNMLPNKAKQFGQLLWDKSSRLCYFDSGPSGLRTLISYGRGTEPVVKAVLAESDAPLHYKEIAQRTNLKAGKIVNERTVHRVASEAGLLFGRGTFGLKKHAPFSGDQMSQIRIEAERIVISINPEKQWHTSEILSELKQQPGRNLEELDSYALDIALENSKILSSLRRMVWKAAWSASDKRIDIRQKVIAILKENGGPMTSSEIKKRLSAARGAGKSFQIFSRYPVVRLDPGLWGLNDRDIPLSRERQKALVEQLADELDKKKFNIHASELPDILDLEGCPPIAFLSIAAEDRRIGARNNCAYLQEWGGPRKKAAG